MGDRADRQSELLAEAGRTLAGGGLGLFVLPPELNLVVERGAGSRVWDVAGREYIDYHLGSGPALLGHAHPAVSAAVAARLDKGTTYFFLNEPEIALARRLIDAVPCAEVVHYAGSGTEATFYALRIARAFTGRDEILKFEGAWHGMHDYGLWGTVPNAPSDYPHARPDSIGVPLQTGASVLVTLVFSAKESLYKAFSKASGRFLAFDFRFSLKFSFNDIRFFEFASQNFILHFQRGCQASFCWQHVAALNNVGTEIRCQQTPIFQSLKMKASQVPFGHNPTPKTCDKQTSRISFAQTMPLEN